MRKADPAEPPHKLLIVERDQRVNITFSRYCFVSHNAEDRNEDACNITIYMKSCCQADQDEPHKFQGIAEFKTNLRIVGDSHKCHVEHDLGIEPAGTDGIISENDAGHYTQGGTEHGGCIQ